MDEAGREKVRTYGFNHTICEVCWFAREPARFPVTVVRPPGDNKMDYCCVCGSAKITRIWVRMDPQVETFVCEPYWHD